MDYFKKLLDLLKIEKEEERRSYQLITETMPVAERRAAGLTWYPIAIRDTEMTRGRLSDRGTGTNHSPGCNPSAKVWNERRIVFKS